MHFSYIVNAHLFLKGKSWGCSSAWLEHQSQTLKVGGSNPFTPTLQTMDIL